MIEELIRNPLFRRFFPPIAGSIFIVIFASLGLWQLDRAAEKKALIAQFENVDQYSTVSELSGLPEFARVELGGEYLPQQQVLIDNIIQDGRPGYYVITPFKPDVVGPVLLVNRGWIAKQLGNTESPDVSLSAGGHRLVRGLVGHLPRVGIRPGEAFAEHGAWPRVAVYPSSDEIAAELDLPVMPQVLLLSPEAEDGYRRQWQPNVSGPATHYGYAVQWFAMAATVVGLFIWHLRKGRRNV